jgi:LPXTG-site transpeptidase (sortase) family protein
MGGIINAIARLIRAGRKIYARKLSFLLLFAVSFMLSVYVLAKLDILPEIQQTAGKESVTIAAQPADNVEASASAEAVEEEPSKIEIKKINLLANVSNPETTDISVLDSQLLKGAVRYPTSALLGEEGNVVIFGHSSYLPVVNNKAYKAFNDIQKLKQGDVISVYSDGNEYTYSVRSVTEEKADINAAIPLLVVGKVLTLVTCNSFGTKQDRFVVKADFVESHPASS